ncbi:MAG TPA: type II secretion system protein [Candidatus Saccharimonadales bacterium]
MRKSIRGFTIIEILVVVAVIATLAGIVFVSYGTVQKNARNADRLTQVQQWAKLFELYRAKYGTFPPVATGNYCLGTGFPLGPDGQGRCRDSVMTDPNYSYLESGNTALMTEIKKIGTIPTVNPPRVHGDLVGPYGWYDGTHLWMTQVFEGGPSDCPTPTHYSWDDGAGVVLCAFTIGN